MSWLFIDPVCPKPYSLHSLSQGGIGGTEATVIRVAEALEGAFVMQHSRTEESDRSRARYIRPDWSLIPLPTSIVVLRCPNTALATRQRFQCVPMYLWLHDLADRNLGLKLPALKQANITIIAVSHFHRHNILEAARTFCPNEAIPDIRVIFNPIEDTLVPDATPVNPNKLVYFSSPHKGLKNTLDLFKGVRNFAPDMELFIANPGYLDWSPESSPGVHVLGNLPRAQALQHVREAFCVFYPNNVFPETFGLVLAEANAVGTPVLTHPFGAAREVLENPVQFVDCADRVKVIDTLMHWRNGNRPVVTGQDQFKLSRVIERWNKLD